MDKLCFSQLYSKTLVFCDSFLKMTEKSLFPKLEVFSLPSRGGSGGAWVSEGFFHLSTFKAGSTLRETSENWVLPFQK